MPTEGVCSHLDTQSREERLAGGQKQHSFRSSAHTLRTQELGDPGQASASPDHHGDGRWAGRKRHIRELRLGLTCNKSPQYFRRYYYHVILEIPTCAGRSPNSPLFSPTMHIMVREPPHPTTAHGCSVVKWRDCWSTRRPRESAASPVTDARASL